MKYPVIKVKELPSNYKQGTKVLATYFNFDQIDNFIDNEDRVMKLEYLDRIKMEIAKVLDANFLTAQSAIIIDGDSYFVTFKSNLDVRSFNVMMSNLMKELSDYVNHTLELSYGLEPAMIIAENKSIGILASSKMDGEFVNCEAYKNGLKKVDVSNTKGHAKYLTSFDEFKKAYISSADNYCI